MTPPGGEGLSWAEREPEAALAEAIEHIERRLTEIQNTALSVRLDPARIRLILDASKRPSSPPSGGGGLPSREEVARMIDPEAWALHDEMLARTDARPEGAAKYTAPSLTKADAILALFPPVVGWRLLPVEPTEAMLDTAWAISDLRARQHMTPSMLELWTAFLSALPAAPLTTDHLGTPNNMVRDHPLKGGEE